MGLSGGKYGGRGARWREFEERGGKRKRGGEGGLDNALWISWVS